MLATSARMVPDIASASTDSFAGANMSLPSSFFTVTRRLAARTSVPIDPLTLICLGRQRDVDALRHFHRHLSYARHGSSSPYDT